MSETDLLALAFMVALAAMWVFFICWMGSRVRAERSEARVAYLEAAINESLWDDLEAAHARHVHEGQTQQKVARLEAEIRALKTYGPDQVESMRRHPSNGDVS